MSDSSSTTNTSWLVHGTTATGGATYSRHYDERLARANRERLKRMGADVEVTQQVRNGNAWRDADTEGGAQ